MSQTCAERGRIVRAPAPPSSWIARAQVHAEFGVDELGGFRKWGYPK